MYKDKFLSYLRVEKRSSENTIAAYNRDLTDFIAYAFETDNLVLSEINHHIIRAWLADLMEKEISARSVNRKAAALSTFCKYLMREGLMDFNPMAKVPKPKTNSMLPEFADSAKLNNFLDKKQPGTYNSVLDNAIMETLYATGMRVSEMIELKCCDIDFERDLIKVFGKRSKERFTPITEHLRAVLINYSNVKRSENMQVSQSDSFFLSPRGRKMNRKSVYLRVKAGMQQAGFTGQCSPHVLRHTFATDLLNGGADLISVKEILGHSSLAATQVYTHNTFEKLKRIYKEAHPRAE